MNIEERFDRLISRLEGASTNGETNLDDAKAIRAEYVIAKLNADYFDRELRGEGGIVAKLQRKIDKQSAAITKLHANVAQERRWRETAYRTADIYKQSSTYGKFANRDDYIFDARRYWEQAQRVLPDFITSAGMIGEFKTFEPTDAQQAGMRAYQADALETMRRYCFNDANGLYAQMFGRMVRGPIKLSVRDRVLNFVEDVRYDIAAFVHTLADRIEPR